ncbi:MAG: hypothetical protein P8I94_08835 [Emcibacteraceae bacterium]|nr:hypothetical protein [Emcibacteraceae bacterium]
MSIIKSFLNKTVVISSLIALSLITIPATAFADRGDKNKRVVKKSKAVAQNTRVNRQAKRNNNKSVVRKTKVVAQNTGGNRQARRNNNRAVNKTKVVTRNNSANRPAKRNNTRVVNKTKVVVQNRNTGRDARRGSTRSYDTGYRAGRQDTRQNVRYNRNTNRAYNKGYRRGSRNSAGAFVGGLIGGSILSSAYSNNHIGVNYNYGYPRYGYNSYGYGYPTSYNYNYGYNYSYPSYRYAPRTNVVYVEGPTQTVVREVPVYTQSSSAAYPQQGYQDPDYQYQAQQPEAMIDNNCLQTREYTTTIEIGGEAVPAYGQACLQPDGSWMFGQPVAVPSF